LAPRATDTIIKFIAIAPSAVLSHIALIALGWLFVVRWGFWGIPYLLLTIAYALLQLPAYFADHFESLLNPPELGKAVFFSLGLLKVPFAFGFLGYLLSPNKPDFAFPKFWPDESIAPHRRIYATVVSLTVIALGPVVTGTIGVFVSEPLKQLILRTFSH
jgi:hypothetical protein